jgi:hypothetical protein
MPAKVLGSFALIACFRDEPGAEAMESLLVAAGKKDAPLQPVNLCSRRVSHARAPLPHAE